jgi:hypothetical protein
MATSKSSSHDPSGVVGSQGPRRRAEDGSGCLGWARAGRERSVSRVRGLWELTDDELIATSPARSSLSYAHNEMEMQRRLKDSIVALTEETAKARRWSLGESVVIGLLTLVLVALTIVLALKA